MCYKIGEVNRRHGHMTNRIKICLNPGLNYNEDLRLWEVCVIDSQGRVYTHNRLFETAVAASELLARVAEAGDINPEHWDCRVPYGTEAWLVDGMEASLMDDEERYHKGM